MPSLDDVLSTALALHHELDEIVESIEDVWDQAQADWISFRLSSIGVVLRDRGGGPIAAVLARGLVEQAAYWDWAVATGVDQDLVPRQAALELQRLHRASESTDDDIWTGWLLPPGAEVGAAGTEGMPRSAADAVKRLGNGLDAACLEPLRFRGLFASYRLLEVLTHGGLAAAHTMRPGGGAEFGEPLAAAIVHVACAGAVASLIGQLELPPALQSRLVELTTDVATQASAVHGLPLGAAQRLRAPAKAGPLAPLLQVSDARRMPPAQPSMTEAAQEFVASADHLADLAVTHIRTDDNATQLIWPSFQMAWAQLHVLRGALDGTLAKALIPFAARPLFEDGARWGWHTVHVANGETSGVGLHSMIADSRNRVIKVRDSLAGDGIPHTSIDHLFGGAIDLLPVQPAAPMPPLDEMLRIAHPSPSGIETANAIYSLLSQFVHATPIAQLHLQQDEFPSLTAPMYAVAVEATCRGFWRIARSTLAISCEKTDELDASLAQLSKSLGDVVKEAMQWHLLG